MSDFILQSNPMQHIPSLLRQAVGFEDSPEYREMRPYELDIPGVICGAFAKYLIRIHAEEHDDGVRPIASEQIASAHEVLAALASYPETAVENLVTDEVFENLEGPSQVIARIESTLHPNALSLYQRWRAQQRGIS
jgi:hypothetical protein